MNSDTTQILPDIYRTPSHSSSDGMKFSCIMETMQVDETFIDYQN